MGTKGDKPANIRKGDLIWSRDGKRSDKVTGIDVKSVAHQSPDGNPIDYSRPPDKTHFLHYEFATDSGPIHFDEGETVEREE
jgi:hypothetical protein